MLSIGLFRTIYLTLGKKKYGDGILSLCMFLLGIRVKAVHLERVCSLSIADFLIAFKRFLAIRRPCKIIYLDREINFMGAETVSCFLVRRNLRKSLN